jgi:2-polyprenyl-3-methyl-5-hydroxy-6-metoxy-1,4-benzoquinol methylase
VCAGVLVLNPAQKKMRLFIVLCCGFGILQQVKATSPRRLNSYPCFASKGFGTGSSSKDTAASPLSKEAKKLLKKHDNNVDAASSEYFQSQMGNAHSLSSVEELHETRVAATWNTVAMFLPQDYKKTKGKVEPYVERRLRHIVTACHGGSESKFDLLDVGCGDGCIVPYLPLNCRFSGLDLSNEMIALAKQRHPSQNFAKGGFPKGVPEGTSYDSILFNGSIQFFRDTRETLEAASYLLKPGGRIVLAHVNGAKFVRDECLKNPAVAVRNMPNNVNLSTMADMLGLRLVHKSELLETTDFDENLDGDIDVFYLVALEKPAKGSTA